MPIECCRAPSISYDLPLSPAPDPPFSPVRFGSTKGGSPLRGNHSVDEELLSLCSQMVRERERRLPCACAAAEEPEADARGLSSPRA